MHDPATLATTGGSFRGMGFHARICVIDPIRPRISLALTLLMISQACRSDHQRLQGRPRRPTGIPKTAKDATASPFVASLTPYAAASCRADRDTVRLVPRSPVTIHP